MNIIILGFSRQLFCSALEYTIEARTVVADIAWLSKGGKLFCPSLVPLITFSVAAFQGSVAFWSGNN